MNQISKAPYGNMRGFVVLASFKQPQNAPILMGMEFHHVP